MGDKERAIEIFVGERRRFVGEHIEILPPEAAALTVEAGIVGPLIEYGGEIGLTAEEVNVITRFADQASEAARRREQEAIDRNPLAQIDIQFAQAEHGVWTNDDMTARERGSLLNDLNNKRKSLRKTQATIKAGVASVVDARQEQGETIDITTAVDQVLNSSEKDGHFYTELVEGGSRNNRVALDVFLGNKSPIIDGLKDLAKTSEEKKASAIGIPTAFPGINFDIRSCSMSYGSEYLHAGISFSREAVAQIAQAPELPPLVIDPPHLGKV